MNIDEVNNEYFEWMYHKVCYRRYADDISYRKLLMQLHSTEFIAHLKSDENRVSDGINLRRRFSEESGFEYDYLSSFLGDYNCSILEMILALAIRCEETIMDDPLKGDRTGQWFWGMIVSLGLGPMTDINYDKKYVDGILQRFINRHYEPNGKGGLFTIRNCNADLRKVDIWRQLCWYLDSIT